MDALRGAWIVRLRPAMATRQAVYGSWLRSMGERRITGAEIVNRQHYAQGLDLLQYLDAAFGPFHEKILRQFRFQPFRAGWRRCCHLRAA